MKRTVVLAAVLSAAAVGTGHGQLPDWVPQVRGYFLNVPIGMARGPFSDAARADFQRLRLMARPRYGPVSFDLAYEQLLTLRSDSGMGAIGGLGAAASLGGGDWLGLQGTLRETEHLAWRHRVDRLSLGFSTGVVEAIVGRQPISWATTLFLTPADPFAPFDPSDPFREYRGGVDAVRLRASPGQFTEIDGVLRMATFGEEDLVTALGRARTAVGPWEIAVWGGVLHEELALSAAATVSVAGGVLRGEAVYRRVDGNDVLRMTIGADRSFVVAGRNVYLVAEYQRDGFGAASPDDLLETLLSVPARRGEMQVYGRDEMVVQGSVELHPLVSADALMIWNLNDPSVLLGPGVSYAATGEVSLRGGVYFGLGTGTNDAGLPGSEFGIVPTTGYLSVSWFF
jgi:hypothetical protein